MRIALVTIASIWAIAAHAVEPLTLENEADWEITASETQSIKFRRDSVQFSGAAHNPATLLSKADFENFTLDFEFLPGKWCASGLMIHAPRYGSYRAAIEIELSGHPSETGTVYSTGALFRLEPPKTALPFKENEWLKCQVRLEWPRLIVYIGGEPMQDIDLSSREDLRYKLRRGAIGFMHSSDELEVRDFKLTPLPDTENGIVMFDGTTLNGWTVLDGPAKFEAAGGAIHASGGNGYLQFDQQFQDFDLRALFRTSPGANGGIFFRWAREDGENRGTEIQIWDIIGGVMPTGSVYGIERANDTLIRPGAWQLLQISVRGSQCVTLLNGELAAKTDALPHLRPGYIVLQMHSQGWIDFKDLVIVPADGAK